MNGKDRAFVMRTTNGLAHYQLVDYRRCQLIKYEIKADKNVEPAGLPRTEDQR